MSLSNSRSLRKSLRKNKSKDNHDNVFGNRGLTTINSGGSISINKTIDVYDTGLQSPSDQSSLSFLNMTARPGTLRSSKKQLKNSIRLSNGNPANQVSKLNLSLQKKSKLLSKRMFSPNENRNSNKRRILSDERESTANGEFYTLRIQLNAMHEENKKLKEQLQQAETDIESKNKQMREISTKSRRNQPRLGTGNKNQISQIKGLGGDHSSAIRQKNMQIENLIKQNKKLESENNRKDVEIQQLMD